MKARWLLFCICALSLISDARAKELVIATALPVKHIVFREGLQPFAKQVEALSNGKLRIVIHSGGSMGGWSESFEYTASGLLDGASIVDTNVASSLPLSNTISSLAMLGEDPRVMAGAINELTLVDSEALLDDWLRNNVRPIAGISLAPFYLLCASEVRGLPDIRGKRIRADASYSSWVLAMGATPVNIRSIELYEALQRSQVDCAIATGAWLRSFSLFDVVTSIVDQRLGLFFGAWPLTMNEHVWAGLPREDRDILLNLAPGIVRRSVEFYMEDDRAVMVEARRRGIQLVPPSADMMALLAKHRKSEIRRVIELAEKRGVKQPGHLVDRFLELVEKWRRIVAETGDDYDAYEVALRREIYSKMNR
jgi:TRAP-type C4-dicarboxylate transport system substrate-binding protein